jgi:GntR family transcriptional repressor for pyruvate dehydrogenase complex
MAKEHHSSDAAQTAQVAQARSSQRTRQTSAEMVTGVLRKRIALGGFAPGERIPTERELASALDVSRNTVRQAIRNLAAEGIIETTHGRGGGSRVLQAAASLKSRGSIANNFREIIATHMEYRRLIEPAVARLAAERGSENLRRNIVTLLETAVPTLNDYHRVDTEFHLLVAEAACNPVLLEAVTDARADLFAEANVLWLHSDWHVVYGTQTTLADVFRVEHTPIAAAIMAGDGEMAERHMHRHLTETEEQFERLLSDLES